MRVKWRSRSLTDTLEAWAWMAADRTQEAGGGARGPEQLCLSGPSTHDSVEALATRVWEMLDDVPMPALARFELETAVHEALTNAAEHGNGGDPAKTVKVACCAGPGRITVAVEDEGSGFDPDALPDPTAEENLLNESGRGILLIRALVDECQFEQSGRRVVLVKHIP